MKQANGLILCDSKQHTACVSLIASHLIYGQINYNIIVLHMVYNKGASFDPPMLYDKIKECITKKATITRCAYVILN